MSLKQGQSVYSQGVEKALKTQAHHTYFSVSSHRNRYDVPEFSNITGGVIGVDINSGMVRVSRWNR
jgi:hypothetical protein